MAGIMKNGTPYFFSSGESYSTDETVVGTFLDKPLYRKIFKNLSVSNDSGWQNLIDVSSLNIEFVSVNQNSLFYITSNSNNKMPSVNLPTYLSISYNSSTKYIETYINNTQFTYVFEYLVLEYTKTTD